MKELMIIIKGLWIGSTMTVPGVSGGTMAVLAGVYEDLLGAVNGLRREPVRNILFLFKFVSGAGIGFFVFAGIISFLLESEHTGDIVRLFFCGIVAGGVPLLINKAEVESIRLRHALCLLTGIIIVTGLSMLPRDLFTAGEGAGYILLQAAGGFIVAIALVLPGISVTHMLYILGLYNLVLERVYALKIIELLPIVCGIIAGVFFTSGVLERLFKKYLSETYLVITGFVAGSVISLIPLPPINYPVISGVMFIIGAAGMYMLSTRAV